ncbi:MAG: tetratricopeptide repeat protein [Bacteroidia bacterium]
MMENNLPVKTAVSELIRNNVGLTKYSKSLIFEFNKNELFQEAVKCFWQEKYHEAYLKFYRIYLNYPKSKRLYPFLAYCVYEIGYRDKIEFFLWKAFEFKVVDEYYGRVETINKKQWRTLKKILPIKETMENALIYIYINIVLENSVYAADAILDRVEKDALLEENGWYYYFRGIRTGPDIAAIEYYTKAIDLDPYNPTFYRYRGSSNKSLFSDSKESKDSLSAIRDFSKSIKLDPTDTIAYLFRADLNNHLKNYWEAHEDYSKCIELDSTNLYAYSSRAHLNYAREKYLEAFADYDKCIELDKNNPVVYYNRAQAKRKQKDYQGAIKDFTKAIALNPRDVNAISYCSSVRWRVNDYIGAISDYNQLIELNPNDMFSYRNRALAKKYSGDYDGAIKDFTKYIELLPSDISVYKDRGETFMEHGDTFNAEKDLEMYETLRKKK